MNNILEISITGNNSDLKKSLQDSRAELKRFADEVKRGGGDVKTAMASERLEGQKLTNAMKEVRLESARLTLEKKKTAGAVTAASGSYREAQQRLTALGKSIREAAGGFANTSPAIRKQIQEYNQLNTRLKDFDKTMGNHQRNVGNYGSAFASAIPVVSQFTTVAGAASGALGILSQAGKVLFSFDSGMKNVEKTTGLARVEVEKLGKEFLELSNRLEVVSPTKLTEYATVAGQLGVKGSKDILSFTETLAKLETSTNISGEQGGSEIARMLTLVDGGVQNIKAFGDEIVNLGNNFPATEKEILGNAEAIAQNVGIYKIGRQEVLAFATATKSVGIEAELVGSTFNRTLAIFERAIRTGDGLQSILKLIGGNQSQLSKRFKEDASGVFVDFIGALNRIDKEGGSVNEQLENLSINAVRDQRVIQSLATNGYDVLTSALDKSKNASGSLGNEFEVQSTKLTNSISKIKTAWEGLVLGIDSGNGVISNSLRGLADYFSGVLRYTTKLVNSSSWKKLTGMAISPSNSLVEVALNGYGLRGKQVEVGDPTTGYDALRQIGVRGYEDFLPKATAVEVAEQKVAEQVKLNKKYWEQQRDAIQETIEAMDASEVGTKRWIELSKQLASAQSKIDLFGTGKSKGSGGSGKSQADLIKEANEALKGGQIDNLKGIDNQLAKIDKKWDGIVEKINLIGNISKKNELLQIATAERALAKEEARFKAEKKRLELWSKKGLTPLGVAPGTVTPTLPGIPSLAPLQNSFAGRTAGLSKGLEKDDRLENSISRIIERGFKQGIGGILDNITELGSDFQSVFTNVFGQLRNTLQGIFNDIVGTRLGDLFKSNFDDIDLGGLGNKVSQAVVAGAGLVGQLVSGMTSQSSALGQGLGGAISGAAMGTAILPGIGTAVGAVLGGLSGIFGAKKAREQERLQQEQLAESKRQTLLQERIAALSYTSSIVGSRTNLGTVTGIDRDAFGNIEGIVDGKNLKLVIERN